MRSTQSEAAASEPPTETAPEPVASDTEAPKEEAVCAILQIVWDMILTTLQKEEKKPEKRDAKQTAVKVGRRLSSRVGEFFKPKKTEASTPAKVDENPPKIDEPTPVAPLENPAVPTPTAPVAEEAPTPAEEPKPEVPPAAPVVAATA